MLKKKYTNFLGMDFVKIEPGSYKMGNLQKTAADNITAKFAREDEKPIHKVTISEPFYMATAPVTNKQYEQFDPEHRKYRGRRGFSQNDDDAVLFVNWYDANAFCNWLSDKDGKKYRLPTEAEWEYAARAGTKTAYYTGNALPSEYNQSSLEVKKTPPNQWGLYNVHGLVEEWCYDWYGPYISSDQVDPIGYDKGSFRVLRGGSHSTENEYLRSSNRMAQMPEARNWITGFRLVIGEIHKENHINSRQDNTTGSYIKNSPTVTGDATKIKSNDSYFAKPQSYIKIKQYDVPFGSHNHQPAITELSNGDLMAMWYTTKSEKGRELRQAVSRFSTKTQTWEPASIFWDIPDRNVHGCDLFWDKESNVVYHFSGVSIAENDGRSLAVAMRKSFDSGLSWTQPRFISSDFNHRGQVISSTIKTTDGKIIVLCDDLKDGGTAVYISEDGNTWFDPGLNNVVPKFEEGKTGAWIAGIHASIIELENGKLFAAGRGNNIEGKMPFSVSTDGGLTWKYSSSKLPPVSAGQRLTMIRLYEGPILLVGFTDRRDLPREKMQGLIGYDANGNETKITGLFATVSFDEGKTWPIKRVISDGSGLRVDSTDPNQYDQNAKNKNSNRIFTMNATSGEAMGYCDLVQAQNGIIHLISSKQHYQFNYQWLVEYK